ncbi:MAG: DUF420 domain-containing protein [Phycisphaerales bacterium]|nr:DUF420 domain-containing protein [Phycisphaerales bacterium]
MLQTLPAINAALNAAATIALITGFIAVRRRNYRRHAISMIVAFAISILFLVFYLWHKILLHQATGSYNVSTTGFQPAWLRLIYLFVLLLPHLLLAMIMLPLILATFYFAARRNWVWHKRFSRPAFWIWLYVSISGVLIYFMLYHIMRVA